MKYRETVLRGKFIAISAYIWPCSRAITTKIAGEDVEK
jgi:hypothetical protein